MHTSKNDCIMYMKKPHIHEEKYTFKKNHYYSFSNY